MHPVSEHDRWQMAGGLLMENEAASSCLSHRLEGWIEQVTASRTTDGPVSDRLASAQVAEICLLKAIKLQVNLKGPDLETSTSE